MEIFTTESSHLRSCIEFSTVIRFIKAVFYRSDHQKLLMCSLIKRVDEAFVSKDTSKSLKHKAECFGQAFENLREK